MTDDPLKATPAVELDRDNRAGTFTLKDALDKLHEKRVEALALRALIAEAAVFLYAHADFLDVIDAGYYANRAADCRAMATRLMSGTGWPLSLATALEQSKPRGEQ